MSRTDEDWAEESREQDKKIEQRDAVLQRVVDAYKVYAKDPKTFGPWFVISIQTLAHEIERDFGLK